MKCLNMCCTWCVYLTCSLLFRCDQVMADTPGEAEAWASAGVLHGMSASQFPITSLLCCL